MLAGGVSLPAIVQVSFTTQSPGSTEADTVALGLLEGQSLPQEAPAALGELLDSGEARRSFKSLALAHVDGKRWLLVGLGDPNELTGERARVAGAVALARAKELSTKTLCWQAPGQGNAQIAAALVEGTILADYRFDAFKSGGGEDADGPPKQLQRLIVSTPDSAGTGDPESGGAGMDAQALEQAVTSAALLAESVNEAKDLQNRPGNDLTPSELAQYARGLGEEIEGLVVQTEGRKEIIDRSMGAFAAVAQGSQQEPALITMRYEPPSGATGPLLGFVGKAVTFDSGGISLKPGAKMAEMKFDMSGGAAVIEAVAAIARLKLPVRVMAVVGATENLPSGSAVKPGDIVTASNGKTIEVNNTDAEGRLVLADCLSHAVSLGAERIVDLATLTGAVIIALGSTYAGLMSNDDELAERVAQAGDRTGEIVWRLPLHEEYVEIVKGTYADLDNAPEGRKAGTITGATFLANFVGDVPWVHLDIAGSAWDLGRVYASKGASGYGVRLLVELARSYLDAA